MVALEGADMAIADVVGSSASTSSSRIISLSLLPHGLARLISLTSNEVEDEYFPLVSETASKPGFSSIENSIFNPGAWVLGIFGGEGAEISNACVLFRFLGIKGEFEPG